MRTPPATRDWFSLPLRSRTGWVLLLGAMTALHAVTLDLYLPSFPQLRENLSTTPDLVRLTLTGTLVGIALGQLVAGPLSDALGRRTPLLVGLALHVAASVGCALAPTIEVLSVLRVLQGLGAAAAAVTALAVAGDLFDGAGATRLVSRLVLVIGASPVLAPTLGTQLLQVVDWRGIFAVLAVVGAALTVVVAVRLPETLPRARRRPSGVLATASTYRRLLADRATCGLVVTGGLISSVIFTFVAGAPLVLQDLYGLGLAEFSAAFAAVAACLVIGTQVAAQLMGRVAPERVMLLGLAGALVASIILVQLVTGTREGSPDLVGVVVLLSVVLLCTGVAFPGSPAMIVGRNGWATGSAAALFGGSQFSVGAAVLPVVATVGLRGDLAVALAMVAGATLALVALTTVVLPVLRRAETSKPVTAGVGTGS